MAIVGGLDVHRRQITFDYLDSETGQVRRGQIPGTRPSLRSWLARLEGQPGTFAVEGCTGWRFVVEELERAGMTAHLAEPADTAALRGPKRRAKTDGLDCPVPPGVAGRGSAAGVMDSSHARAGDQSHDPVVQGSAG